ncbi:PGA [Symbiodinium sp. CCMP2456]|nr:PGA [Symbiodinium sp. CCMP2456]
MHIYCAQETHSLNDCGALQIHGNCPEAAIELLRLDNHTADLRSQSPVVAVSCGHSLQNWRDHICLGDICTHGNFISVTEETEQPFSLVPFDGIFGLGLPQMSQAPHFNVLDCMIRDKVLKKNLFSVFLAADDRDESEISFGEFKSDRMADQLFWVPVSNPGYWQVEMEDVAVGDKLQGLCNGKCQAAVDTGTSLLAGPSDVVRTVAGKEGACRVHQLDPPHMLLGPTPLRAVPAVSWVPHASTSSKVRCASVVPAVRGRAGAVACLVAGLCRRSPVRCAQLRATPAGPSEDLEKQWQEYYERDERDAEEGWAIDVLDDDTLLKQILSPSPRQSRVVRPMLGDKVTIHFTARVVDGDIFETTREDNTGPLKFRIGHGEVMRGLEESVMSMSKGEISRFYIAPELAFGDQGRDKVPPGSSLEYEIELVNVVDMDPDVDEFNEDIEIPKDLDKMGKNDVGEGGKDPLGKFYWERHGQDMLVFIPIDPAVSSRDVDCLLLKTHISAAVAGEAVFDGEPGLEIDEDESDWEIESRGGRRDYVDRDGHTCTLSLMTMDVPPPKGPLFIFGDPLLRKYYTVYDRENLQVGFAMAAQPRRGDGKA